MMKGDEKIKCKQRGYWDIAWFNIKFSELELLATCGGQLRELISRSWEWKDKYWSLLGM